MNSWPFIAYSPPPATPGESIGDYRSRVANDQLQLAERKRRDLADRFAAALSPAERIRSWESAYGLRLPNDNAHPILKQIAMTAKISLEEVHEEQRRRAAPA